MHCKKWLSMSLSSLAVVFVSFLLTMFSTGTTYALNHSGNITSSETWYAADNPHIVTNYLFVHNGATLTIEPGCLVKFDGVALFIGYYGPATLNAVGTSGSPITFTSNDSTPAPGDWRGIAFFDSADDASIMDYCTVEYGGYVGGRANIWCSQSSPTIRHCITRNSSGYGIHTEGSGAQPLISCSTITNNAHYGVGAYTGSNPTIVDCSITGNTGYGVFNDGSGSITIDAENNWWGSADGPGGVGPGSGDAVSDYVDYTPWRTSPGTCMNGSPCLAAYYAFDEGAGTIASDSSGNGNDGVISGAAWMTGKKAGGLSFDGVDDSVSIPSMNFEEISVCA